jgi:hypothetical protein
MTVIDGVKPEVLDMPAKGRELHAHVNPWNGDSANFLVVLIGHAENGTVGSVCVVEVE